MQLLLQNGLTVVKPWGWHHIAHIAALMARATSAPENSKVTQCHGEDWRIKEILKARQKVVTD